MRKVSTTKPLAVKRFMEDNPLAAAFVLEAIVRYAQETIDYPAWKGTTLINQNAWRRIAEAARDMAVN
jgi:hypothetical protein